MNKVNDLNTLDELEPECLCVIKTNNYYLEYKGDLEVTTNEAESVGLSQCGVSEP